MNESKLVFVNRSSPTAGSTFLHYLQLFYVPCLASLGICGNIICAIVFSTKSLR